MAELPILPLKTDALLADTSHMTAEEFGAYCRLLFTMWRHGAQLPDDASELARIVGVDKKKWKRMSARVMRPMNVVDGVILQKRLSSTWLEVKALRKKRAHAAHKRWISKSNASASKSDASADAHAYAEQMHLDAVCNANQIRKKETTSLPSAAREAPPVDNPAVGPATALPTGAPSRPPGTANDEAKGQPSKQAKEEKRLIDQAEYMARVGGKP